MSKRSAVVAFQGERGAFSEEAARKLLGKEVEVLPCQRFEEIFEAVAGNRAGAALVPIENTLHGSVHENYDNLLKFGLPIVGETHLRIVHNLIAPPGTTFAKLRRIYSHPVAINQCLQFFKEHPQLERVPFYDTAGSVKHLMETGEEGSAAIASSAAAEHYGAKILKRAIEDDRENFTRFFLIRKKAERKRTTGHEEWKTSVVFSLQNMPGALFRAMSVFALRDISLTKIESRPMRGRRWEYHFYIDYLAHVEDETSQRALSHLSEFAQDLHVLGSYPRGA